MKVIGKWIKVEPIPTISTSLYIPDSVVEKPMMGEVIEVGDKCVDIEVGDTVFFSKFACVDGKYIREPEVSLIIQKQK